MATEARRGCGYRKVGGIYLVSDALGAPCDRMPYPLEVCPCCGAGVKPARGWTWIDPVKLFGEHMGCRDTLPCPICQPAFFFGEKTLVNGKTLETAKRAGLLWIGDQFYSPTEFLSEAAMLGVSRRISAVPRGFKVGETWVFLAHSKACHRWDINKVDPHGQIGELEEYPGIFCVFKPKRIELIVNQSEYDAYHLILEKIAATTDEFEIEDLMAMDEYKTMQRAVDRGMTLVPVPDNDKDHH